MIASAFVAYHHLNQLDAKKMKFMALGLALSVILDIAWLAIYNNVIHKNNIFIYICIYMHIYIYLI